MDARRVCHSARGLGLRCPNPRLTRQAALGGVRGHGSVGRLNKQSWWRRQLALGGGDSAFPAFRASRCPPPGPDGGREIIRRGRSAPGGLGWPPDPGAPG